MHTYTATDSYKPTADMVPAQSNTARSATRGHNETATRDESDSNQSDSAAKPKKSKKSKKEADTQSA
jgi:hypothetical protein